jgi:hypothetical protein
LIQRVKRWLFSRCKLCDGRFTWHESDGRVVGMHGWDGGKPPSWFKNTESIAHFPCYEANKASKARCPHGVIAGNWCGECEEYARSLGYSRQDANRPRA